jgi:hypothetical protein
MFRIDVELMFTSHGWFVPVVRGSLLPEVFDIRGRFVRTCPILQYLRKEKLAETIISLR